MFTSSLVSLAHGTNDAQKTMGVITLTLIAAGFLDVDAGPPFLVIAACAVAIAAGTYAGGWRIIKTLGRDLTDVEPAQGFAAEASTTATILASSHLGFALSTTQVASGSVIGTGLGRKGAKVRWGTAGKIAIGWLITIPASGGLAALAALARRGRHLGRDSGCRARRRRDPRHLPVVTSRSHHAPHVPPARARTVRASEAEEVEESLIRWGTVERDSQLDGVRHRRRRIAGLGVRCHDPVRARPSAR